ncbi:TonB-dependent receptor [Sediminibacterium soli]|uniref:TonB-dependent receptor n=1 Tax=Sediminibacterium soli TaxID=2698829 RepID=UPI00137B06F4|nr:TonB-dependent receptor plug domain-containing protein [Sediminibacterium soli]NCI47099.1 TonB-dependent receptor [Sediminibacterium soli]
MALCTCCLAATAQQAVDCVVKDLYLGQPIPYARVIVSEKDTLLTDEHGVFRLSLSDDEQELLYVSATGYAEKYIRVSNTRFPIVVFLDAVNYQTNAIQVRGLYNGKNLFQTPGSIATLVSRDLQRNNQIDLPNTFNLLPGVRMELRNINTSARIILRGYGNQNNINGIGYKAYYNDIPLTEADGTTNLDDIDYATLGRVEVFRGPVSSIYGTGIGGVVNLLSEKAPDGLSVRQSLLAGSFGLFRTTTSVGIGNAKTNILFSYGRQKSDGFRMQNRSDKNFWDMNATLYNSPRSTITVFAQYTKSYDDLSGQVDSFGLANYPDTAELSYIRNNSHSELESIRLGLSHEYAFSKLFSNKTTFFIGIQEIGQGLAAILTKTNKNTFGLRSAFIYTPRIGNVDMRITLGMEGTKNIIYQKSYNLNNSALGSLRTDQELKPSQWNIFSMLELMLAKNTLMVFSGSANFITYDNEDLRASGGGYVNQSGYRTFKPIVTPRWVVNHLISRNVSVYANYSMGYAQPGTNQYIITQTGKTNEDVGPEISNTFEVGTKMSMFRQSLNLAFAFFNMDVTDKLVPQNFAAVSGSPAYVKFVNAGIVNFTGMELTMDYALRPRRKSFLQLLRPFLSYTYNNSRNSDLKSDNNHNTFTRDYSSKHVSGIPRDVFNFGLDLEAGGGFYLNLTNMYTGRIPINMDNTAYSEGYNLANAKAGFRKSFGKNHITRWSIDVYGGSNNVFDARYAQFVVINLFPLGGVPPKYYTPAPGTSYYGGMSLRYFFR